MPPGDGGPNSLKRVRDDQKGVTLRSAEKILAELVKLGLVLSEQNWNVAKAAVDPNGASWRATYRPHVSHLFAARRRSAAKEHVTEAEATALRDERDRALQCVRERDSDIEKLRTRIAQLEVENSKLGRGTRARRRRGPRQDRQAEADVRGSD